MDQHYNAADQHRLLSHQALSLVEKYDGEDDALAWLDSVNTLAELYYWTEDVCLRVARLCMKGPAWRWIHPRRFNDWDDFQDQFARRFGETRETAVARLSRCYQHYDESPEAFADRFLENAERAGRTEDSALVYQFLGRLRPELRREAVRKQPQSVAEAVDFCNYWMGAMADDHHEPEYSSTAGFSATPDLQTLAYSMQLYYLERREEQDTEISRLRCALQQQREQPRAATQLHLADLKARAVHRTKTRAADLGNAADDSDDRDSITEPIMFNYLQPADTAHDVNAGSGFAADDSNSNCGSQDEPLMTNYLQPQQFDNCVDNLEPDSSNSSEEAITPDYMQPLAAQPCHPLETSKSGHHKCFSDTDQTTEPLNQVPTATSTLPAPVVAMAIPGVCLPADHAPLSQPLEQSSLFPEGLVPPPAEAATQERIPLYIVPYGSKLKHQTTLPNDEKGNCLPRLVLDGQLHNGKLLNDPECWQPSTAVPSVPPLPWPPPWLMDSE